MKLKIVLSFFAIAFIMSSCAFHGGAYQSSASLNKGNFKVAKTVFGQAKTTKIFGTGGLGKAALVAEARASLLSKYPLEKNQILANVSVDSKTSFILMVGINKVTITADIIEFEN